MSTYTFHIQPRDLLFMRDARPMAASDAGLGANWPRPDQVWSAFIHAFNRRWPEWQEWEHVHNKTAEDRRKSPTSRDRFGGLKTMGPFPATQDCLFLPCPQDLSFDREGVLHPMRLVDGSGTNLPHPLMYNFQSSHVGKRKLPEWLTTAEYKKYLNGESFKPRERDLYDVERQIGVALNPETGTTEDGKIYQAEYLRLRDEIHLAVAVSCVNIGKGERTDVIARIADETDPLILGGQQGVVTATRLHTPIGLPRSADGNGRLVRWTLLSPAVYPALEPNLVKGVKRHPGGWLPTWVDAENGQVMLPRGDLPRKPEKTDRGSRETWRQAMARMPKFSAKLVAARVVKPMAFSGWDLVTGPKSTQLAVPAGSCYVFECVDEAEASELVRALAWHGAGDGGDGVAIRRSTIFGEKGFGIGVCSVVESGMRNQQEELV